MTVLSIDPLGFPWATTDPFLFCVHHLDHYPAGTEELGPDPVLLQGRRIGMDFELRDGWRMYHGQTVPGFPRHPHRGFETVTVARQGVIDHSDSMGATARYGGGDLQWMTAGDGIVHSEMFPLLDSSGPNPCELFQIWLNLPAASKRAPANFAMHWDAMQPRVSHGDGELTIHAGALYGLPGAPEPPPASWAADPRADLAIATIRIPAGGKVELPPAKAGTKRSLYFFDGEAVVVSGTRVSHHAGLTIDVERSSLIEADGSDVELLLLQGRPIGEPVAHHGPFVMNTADELREAVRDYQRTGFGGWPWDADGPVHARDSGRFAQFADGTRETPE